MIPPDYAKQLSELAEDFNGAQVEIVNLKAALETLPELQQELEETQEDLTEQLKENEAMLSRITTLEIRLQRAEAILVTGALAFKATQ